MVFLFSLFMFSQEGLGCGWQRRALWQLSGKGPARKSSWRSAFWRGRKEKEGVAAISYNPFCLTGSPSRDRTWDPKQKVLLSL
jgi:hypothetical protein